MAGSKRDYKGTPEERFWKKVNKDGPTMRDMPTNCWVWTGAKGQSKYPQINIEGKIVKAVRFSYELANGSIPGHHHVRHYCSNNFCVRPDHLFISPDRGSWNTKSSPLVQDKGQLYKHCSKCKNLLLYTSEFFSDVGQGRGLRSYCKQCAIKHQRKRRVSSWDYILWVQAKDSAARIGVDFNLTRQDIKRMFSEQKGLCHWFKVPMAPSEKPRYPFQPSIDRLNLDGGYTLDNVVLCCYVANIGRNHNTVEEFTEFIKVLRESLTNDPVRS